MHQTNDLICINYLRNAFWSKLQLGPAVESLAWTIWKLLALSWKDTADVWNFCGNGQRETSSSTFSFLTESLKSHPWEKPIATKSDANLSRQYMAVLNVVRSADFCFSCELERSCVPAGGGVYLTASVSCDLQNKPIYLWCCVFSL